MVPELVIDQSFGVEDAEGMVILAGDLEGERTRIQIASDVWRLVLDHFRIGLTGGPDGPTPEVYGAVEKLGSFIMERRGVPQYGVLNISLD
jgi:hypothetical protein